MKKLLLVVFLSICVSAASAADWRRLAGASSGVTETRMVKVTDAKAWRDLWAEHIKGSWQPSAAPEVDFGKEMVVAVFLGERPTNGYSVAVRAEPDASRPDRLVVRYTEKQPRGGRILLPALSQPFEMVKVPKSYAVVEFVPEAAVETQAGERKAGTSAGSENLLDAVAERLGGLASALGGAKTSPLAFFDGGSSRAEAVLAAAQDLPPPPGQKQDKPLPPPPGKGGGKPLPPPPGSGDDDGDKPLPPPPGKGKPLPPPPQGPSHPRPVYPNGPLPSHDPRLRDAERAFGGTLGMQYIGYWNNGQSYGVARGRVETSPSDGSAKYVLNLQSSLHDDYILFYYDAGDKSYYWVPDSEAALFGGVSRRVEVEFTNRAQTPLLPWEKEAFVFTLTGKTIRLESTDGAYDYDVSFVTNAADPGRIAVLMTAKAKRLTAPDPGGVSVRLEATASGLKLVVTDRWAQHYTGETLEVAAVVRKDDGSFWSRDPKVFDADARNPVRIPSADRSEVDISGQGRGKYYLESWSFRRAGSAVSSGGWIGKGQGNTVTK